MAAISSSRERCEVQMAEEDRLLEEEESGDVETGLTGEFGPLGLELGRVQVVE